jgi:hypothetical protein
VTEGESPMPMNRVFLDYNFYDNARGGIASQPSVDVHREMIGFERAFLDGNASVGVRVPFLQQTGSDGLSDSILGDISVILKYALLRDTQAGNVLSTGIVMSFPSGQSLQDPGLSSINSYVFQPFVGYVWHLSDDMFIQGFSSLAVPSDMRDVTLLFNSVAIGYRAYHSCESDSMIRSITPQLELHLTDPLSHRGLNRDDIIAFADQFNVTGGLFVNFGRATLGTAVGLPLMGPKPYDIELAANLNICF